jgi:hypothetical protein
MAKLFIIAGHGAGDSGATGGGQTEAENVRRLAAKIKELGGDQVEVLDTSRNWYADGGVNSLQIPSDGMVLELHRDSSSGSARGAHVIIKSGYSADAFDNALAQGLASIFPGRSSIIVGRSDLANINRAAARGINYRLAEVGFIDNATDREIFDNNLDQIAQCILQAAGLTATQPTVEESVQVVTQVPGDAINDAGLKYRAHVQNLGWLEWVHDGQVAGTQGCGLRLEAVEFDVPEGLELTVKAHIENIGWTTVSGIKKGGNTVVGTVGKGNRLEAIEVVVDNNTTGYNTLNTQVHVQNLGWMATTEDSYATGTTGQGLRIEAIKMWLA